MLNTMKDSTQKKNNSPFITIAIASYNYGSKLRIAFEAIKRQKFTNYEILYVDDCSRDNSVEVIESFIRDNPKMDIRLLKNEKNMGLVYSKNKLLANANGQYIMLCDADDWMEDNCLEILADIASNTNADRIVPQVKDVDINGHLIQIQDFNENQSKWLWNIHHGVLYKMSVIRESKIIISGYPDDVYFSTSFNFYAEKTVFIKKSLYNWLVHNDSAGRKKMFDNKLDEVIENYSKLFIFISKKIEILQTHSENTSIFENLAKDANVSSLSLLILKCYYLAIFFELRKFPLMKQLQGYNLLHKNILRIYPSYLKNPYLLFLSKSPMRPYATKIVRFCALFERLHVMKIVIFFYAVISKFITFDQ